MTDEMLLVRLRSDDATALRVLLDRHWRPLVDHLTRSLDLSTDVASDVAQETFCRLWDRRADWRTEGSLRGLLARLGRNIAISEHRRLAARDRAACVFAESVVSTPPADRSTDRNELRGAIARGIAALPGRRREVFVLRRVHGKSHREIATLMGTSTQTVANQLGHAVATLRRELAYLKD